VAEPLVLPPQRRWAAAGIHAPRHPQSEGVMEVGAAAGAPDPPEVTTGGTAEALGSWSNHGRSCHVLPPAVGTTASRPLTPPRRDDPQGLCGKLPDGLGCPLHR
jgi:hypothetical protein